MELNEISLINLVGIEIIVLVIVIFLVIMRNMCMCGELHFNSESYLNYILLGLFIGCIYTLIVNPTGLIWKMTLTLN